ncbi:MAG: 3-isopropylmalate dehydrogenase [Bacillota bacterium]|nr:3-isopropylmalate dehydrogenase [Bacillota bacterium]
MTEFRVAVLPGDGIGPEVVREGVKVLRAAADRFRLTLTFHEFTVGGAAYERYGVPLRPEDLEAIKECQAVLLGAVGGPAWDDLPAAVRPEKALFTLRKELGLYANLRPVRAYPELASASSLRPEVTAGVDLLIVRELTGGLYFGEPRRRDPAPDGDGWVATDTLTYSTGEIRRIVRLAFTLAQGRRRQVTSVDKANVLESSRLWRETAREVAREFPEVALTHQLVDNTALQLARAPGQFDVLVTENLFGDILSDEAAAIAGSLGMLPSASLGGRTALYEPCHGSAPDIAGRGIANPLGAILSVALLLRHSVGHGEAARAVEEAVAQALASGARTADLARGGEKTVSTAEMGDLVAGAVGSRLKG